MTGAYGDAVMGLASRWENGERVLAAYYDARRGDPGEWAEPVRPKPRRRLASMFSVRLTPNELALVRSAADGRGLSVSAFLRMAALKEAGVDLVPVDEGTVLGE